MFQNIHLDDHKDWIPTFFRNCFVVVARIIIRVDDIDVLLQQQQQQAIDLIMKWPANKTLKSLFKRKQDKVHFTSAYETEKKTDKSKKWCNERWIINSIMECVVTMIPFVVKRRTQIT